ncbi:hypothetical protein [Streptomyces sp. CC224B]|uniref:hypothetical protein n=1 Tax=Streptomyces sp. CC224B TaxID=3044571 RepID=UPI0024A83D0E|nr:hypothetical protein [Streptomyces sp. CC224B]
MGLFKKSPEEKSAIAEMKAADAALHANQRREEKAGIRHETPEYERLNKIANEKAKEVSFWRGGTKR